MARQARVRSESGIYHAMMRGINREIIFYDDEDCSTFLRMLAESLAPRDRSEDFPTLPSVIAPPPETAPPEPGVPAEVYAWCLLGNHLHLLLREGSEGVSILFKRVGIRYTFWYNHKYQRTGHLFQDRFRSEPIETEADLLAVYRYIWRNPVKAGITNEIGEYEWCSYQHEQRMPGLLSPDLPLGLTWEKLMAYMKTDQADIYPFPEHLSDREAGEVLLQVCKLTELGQFRKLLRGQQAALLMELCQNGLTLQQVARLTGVPKSSLIRWRAAKLKEHTADQ